MVKYIYNIPLELSLSNPASVISGCISVTSKEYIPDTDLMAALEETMRTFTQTNYRRTAGQFAEVLGELYPEWDVALTVIKKPVTLKQESR